MSRRRLAALLTTLLVVVVGLVSTTTRPAASYAGAPWFRPSSVYTQNFPDPSVIVSGDTYYAYATSTGGSYLPAMSSTDLSTWVARPAYDPGPPLNSDRFFNDALPYPPSWSPDRDVSGRMKKEIWAPGVAAIGGRFVAFYAARVALDHDRFCLSVATSPNALGPFSDSSTAPLWCDDDLNGSIDPQPFVDADGSAYLLWKSEGVPGILPTRIWSRPLDATGTAFAPGSSAVALLETSQPWEGFVIENPSLVRWEDRLYLFYSGNEHRSDAYATGYAECATPAGPCSKSATNPVLASHEGRLGPGGPSAFVTPAGQLMLAYHWWNAPYTGYPPFPQCQQERACTTQGQRRMAVERVQRTAVGLQVGGHPVASGLDGQLAVAMATTPVGHGYWIAGADGAVAARGGAALAGSVGALTRPIVGMAATPSGDGYWMTGGDGGVFSFGDAGFHGSTGDLVLNRPIVGMAAAPSGRGYRFVGADGGIFSFGEAAFLGSTGSMALNQPVVGMASTPSGAGYWLVASDGGIFSFGDAAFFGSTGSIALNQPIVGMAAEPAGDGYWLVARDGGIFSFGSARFLGSTGDIRLNQPIVGMAATPSAAGYFMVASDGGIFTFGDAAFHGSGD